LKISTKLYFRGVLTVPEASESGSSGPFEPIQSFLRPFQRLSSSDPLQVLISDSEAASGSVPTQPGQNVCKTTLIQTALKGCQTVPFRIDLERLGTMSKDWLPLKIVQKNGL
jgi:hypothetical protein